MQNSPIHYQSRTSHKATGWRDQKDYPISNFFRSCDSLHRRCRNLVIHIAHIQGKLENGRTNKAGTDSVDTNTFRSNRIGILGFYMSITSRRKERAGGERGPQSLSSPQSHVYKPNKLLVEFRSKYRLFLTLTRHSQSLHGIDGLKQVW